MGCWNVQRAGSQGISDSISPFVLTIANIKKMIAPVVCIAEDSNRVDSLQAINGTAFFLVDSGVFLTPAHVIDVFHKGQPLAGCAKPSIYFPKEKWQGGGTIPLRWFQFDPAQCVEDSLLDLAKCHTVLDLSAPEYSVYRPQTVTIDPAVQDDGTSVAFTGYPLGNSVPISSVGIIGGYVSADTGSPFGKILVDKSAWPGASGSPIYLQDGKVVGMVIATGTGLDSGITIGRGAGAIADFLKAH
jgi:V8-like Glu-specific endopeptidase